MSRLPAILVALFAASACVSPDPDDIREAMPERIVGRFSGTERWNTPTFQLKDGRTVRVAVTVGPRDGSPVRLVLRSSSAAPYEFVDNVDVIPGQHGYMHGLPPGSYYLSAVSSGRADIVVFEGGGN